MQRVFAVLSAAGMGSIHRTSRTKVLRFRAHRYRRKSSLLRLPVLQRNRFDYTQQTCRRRRRESHTGTSAFECSANHHSSQYNVRTEMSGSHLSSGLYRNVSSKCFLFISLMHDFAIRIIGFRIVLEPYTRCTLKALLIRWKHWSETY